MHWDSSDVAEDSHMLAESLKEAFGQSLKRIFSDHEHTSIDYTVIFGNIYEANDDQHWNEHMMGVPILLDRMQLYLSCRRMKLQTVVQSTPAQNGAAQRID
jgi:hypothetical protein